MSSRLTSSLAQYNVRLFTTALVSLILLCLLSTWLPWQHSVEQKRQSTEQRLQSWYSDFTLREDDFAAKADFESSMLVGEHEYILNESSRAVGVHVLAHESEISAARKWFDIGLPGFRLDNYFIESTFQDRIIGTTLWTPHGPRLAAVRSSDSGDQIDLLFGPTRNDAFQTLLNDAASVAVFANENIAWSSSNALESPKLNENDIAELISIQDRITQTEAINTRYISALHATADIIPLKDFDDWDVVGMIMILHDDTANYAWVLFAGSGLVSLLLVAVVFFFIGRDQLHKEKALFGMVPAMLLMTLVTVISFIIFTITSEILSPGFLLSLAFAGVLIAHIAMLAIVLLFIAAVRRFQHLEAMRQSVAAAGFLAPAAVYIALFVAGPVLFALFISFFRWDIIGPDRAFVGLSNYAELLGDPLFWNSLVNTLIYTLHVPFAMAIALLLAMALQRNFRGVTILRTLFFLPYITSFVAISTVWQWLYNTDFGLLNYLLSFVGLGPVNWLSDPGTAMISIMVMSIWIQMGYMMVVFIAGLQAIPVHLYEAASIEGVGRWAQFRKITLPLLRPTVFFILVTSIINSFQVFTYVYVMTQGGPLHSTEVLVYQIYKNAWEYFRMGYASALSWVLFLLIMLVTLLQFTYFRKKIAEVT